MNSPVEVFLNKIYLASFNRSPDFGGMQYWSQGLALGQSEKDIGGIIFSLPIVQAIYPESLSDSEFVESIYHNVFGRSSDADGLDYWSNEVASLRSQFEALGSLNALYEARGQLAINMINAGLGTPEGTEGKLYIENRLNASMQINTYLAEKGIDALSPTQLMEMMKTVDANPLSLIDFNREMYDLSTNTIPLDNYLSVGTDASDTFGLPDIDGSYHVVNGFGGDDTLWGQLRSILFGDTGQDTFVVNESFLKALTAGPFGITYGKYASADGGFGVDTMQINANDYVFDFGYATALASSQKSISSIEMYDLTQGDNITFKMDSFSINESITNYSVFENTGRLQIMVNGGADDHLDFMDGEGTSGWVIDHQVNIVGSDYNVWNSSDGLSSVYVNTLMFVV